MNPEISILVPNYNHASFLEQRIKSILSQTFQDFEIILLDDASTDSSIKILSNYKKHPKVSHCVFNKKNSGSPFGLWKMGFKLAKGKYVWIAESDDWSDLKFLEKLVPKFENTKTVVAHCKSFNVNTYTNIVKENNWWVSFGVTLWDNNFVENGTTLLKNYGKFKCPVINVSSALIRKSVIENIKIPIEYSYCGDWLFWAKIFNLGEVAYSKNALNFIRIHPNSATGENNAENLEKILENFKVANQITVMLGKKFKYHKNYNWLLNLLVQETSRNSNFLKFKYISSSIPLSFLLQFYKQLILKLFNKILHKI